MQKHYWIFKTEPSTYSIDDLQKEKTTEWYGIRNYQARNMIRDDIGVGDTVLVYHSNTKEIGIVGLARVVSEAYPDTEQFAKQSPYFDQKSKSKTPAWLARDIAFVSKFPKTLLLADLRTHKKLANMRLLQKGNRLSITPVTQEEFDYILTLAKK
jgi:predicted RNA-binding protein with PUA-like domain